MFLKGDFYEVTGGDSDWVAHVFQGNNIIDTIPATSEKQAHFLAQQSYPDAETPGQMNKIADADYYSAEGRRYRASVRAKRA